MSDQPYRPDPLGESFDAGAPPAGGDPTTASSAGADEHVAFPEIPAFAPGAAPEAGLPASAWSSPMAELDAAGIGAEPTAASATGADAPTVDERAADREPPVPAGGPMAPSSPRTIPGMQPVSPPVQPPPGTGFGGAGGPGGGTRWTPPNRANQPFQTGERRGCTGKVIGLVVLFLVAPVLIGIFMTIVGAFTHDDEDGGSGSRPAPSTSTPPPSVVTTIPVQARPVTGIPKTATTMRFEVYGAGRTVELRWYISGKSTRLEDMRLPYAASVPIGEDSDYVSLSASDYAGADKNGAGSMECRAYVGDVLVATNVGTTRVECTVSRAQLPASAR